MNNLSPTRNYHRIDNPSFTSKLITNLLNKQSTSLKPSKADFTAKIKINERLPEQLQRSYSQIIKIGHEVNPERKTSFKLQKQSSSRMSNFGSSSLSKVNLLSNDRQVYQKQHKGRQNDIISHTPHEYRDSIKVFPKIRFENFDQDFWRRKSFIEGIPSNAFNYYSNNRMQSQKSRYEGMRTNSNSIFSQK